MATEPNLTLLGAHNNWFPYSSLSNSISVNFPSMHPEKGAFSKPGSTISRASGRTHHQHTITQLPGATHNMQHVFASFSTLQMSHIISPTMSDSFCSVHFCRTRRTSPRSRIIRRRRTRSESLLKRVVTWWGPLFESVFFGLLTAHS